MLNNQKAIRRALIMLPLLVALWIAWTGIALAGPYVEIGASAMSGWFLWNT